MGLGGNVWEWQETEVDLINDNGPSPRLFRGSSCTHLWGDWSLLAQETRGTRPSQEMIYAIGVRVVKPVPEPSAYVLAVLGLVVFRGPFTPSSTTCRCCLITVDQGR